MFVQICFEKCYNLQNRISTSNISQIETYQFVLNIFGYLWELSHMFLAYSVKFTFNYSVKLFKWEHYLRL